MPSSVPNSPADDRFDPRYQVDIPLTQHQVTTPPTQGRIVFTKRKLAIFKSVMENAVLKGHLRFTFEGQEFVPAYAHYLVQYLEQRFRTQEALRSMR